MRSRVNSRDKWIVRRCVWCDSKFKTSRGDSRTCTGKCRLRLATFRKNLGWEPDRPPGDMTAGAAIDLVILTLIRREAAARALSARAEVYRAKAGC